jgi:hypothetical protein
MKFYQHNLLFMHNMMRFTPIPKLTTLSARIAKAVCASETPLINARQIVRNLRGVNSETVKSKL